jgi:hypothetical protein
MNEKYFFTGTEAGLTLMLMTTLSLRRAGFKTRTHVEHIAHFPVHVLTATPAPRLTRRERGCDLVRHV